VYEEFDNFVLISGGYKLNECTVIRQDKKDWKASS